MIIIERVTPFVPFSKPGWNYEAKAERLYSWDAERARIVLTPTPEEAKAIATGMIAYYGTYTFDEGTKTITLRIEASSLPNQLGIDQKRTVTSIFPTELKYTNSTIVGGDGKINVTLKRAN